MKTVELSPTGARLALNLLMASKGTKTDDLIAIDQLRRSFTKRVEASRAHYDELNAAGQDAVKLLDVQDKIEAITEPLAVEEYAWNFFKGLIEGSEAPAINAMTLAALRTRWIEANGHLAKVEDEE